MGINLLKMPILFSEDQPRTTCCGCPVIYGIYTAIILSVLSAISSLFTVGIMGCIFQLIYIGIGCWAAFAKDSLIARQVHYWYWVVCDVLAIVAVVIGCFLILFSAPLMLLWFIPLLALCAILPYWFTLCAFYWKEGLTEGSDDYKKV